MESEFKDKIKMANGKILASKVFKNAKIIDVFTNNIIEGNLAISEGKILGIGDYKGIEEIDLAGKYISPTLIDAHVHIESSLLSPPEFAKSLIIHGVETIIADPHEIANVAGLEGIKYILDETEDLPLDVRIMLPSCVPATNFENNGATLDQKKLDILKDHSRVLGLGEMMNYVGVLNGEDVVLDKLTGFKDKIIDGHAPGLGGKALNAYAFSGVKTDHECSTIEEMNERIRLGMYVLIGEGSGAKNAKKLLKGVNKNNNSRCMFCTDDKHPEDLMKEGSIDYNVRLAISMGMEAIDAIKLGSINTALAYGLDKKGAIAPGYEANFIILDDLEKFEIRDVYIGGEHLASKGKMLEEINKNKTHTLGNRIKLYNYKIDDFAIKLSGNRVNVIDIIPNELITLKSREEVKIENGVYVEGNNIAKLTVIERHKALKSMGLGLIKGLGLKNGAIASTIAHDSHNLIIAGDSDMDMFIAMEEIKRINGGLAIVQNGNVLKSVPLEIGGLMSNRSLEDMNKDINEIIKISREKLSLNKNIDPIITLGFMALPVIPHIKLTDKGLFDVDNFMFINLE